MLEITNIRQGAILNHNHGVEDEHGLTVRIEGNERPSLARLRERNARRPRRAALLRRRDAPGKGQHHHRQSP